MSSDNHDAHGVTVTACLGGVRLERAYELLEVVAASSGKVVVPTVIVVESITGVQAMIAPLTTVCVAPGWPAVHPHAGPDPARAGRQRTIGGGVNIDLAVREIIVVLSAVAVNVGTRPTDTTGAADIPIDPYEVASA